MHDRDIIYLDANATTPLRSEALAAMMPFLHAVYGNPSSVHRLGSAARVAIEDARAVVVRALGAERSEVVFTSGGTEANHLALLGLAFSRAPAVIVTTPIEHSSVLRPLEFLRQLGWEIRYARVFADGTLDLEQFEELLRDDRVRVASIGWANNEIGTIQPMAEISRICRVRQVVLHSDAVQAVGKIPVDPALADLLSISAHKFGGPKGVGCVVVRKGVELAPLLRGGSQERGLRAGTENVAGVVGMARALALAAREVDAFVQSTRRCRDRLWAQLAEVSGVRRFSGLGDQSLPNTLMVAFEGVNADGLVAALDLSGVCVSAGSACAAGAAEPSHVLLATGVPADLARNAVRFSLGRDISEALIDAAAERIVSAVHRLRDEVGQPATEHETWLGS